MSIAQRIEHAFLEGERAVRFSVLAERLYPDKQSWRYSANGGPPGCYISLASALRRHKIKAEWYAFGLYKIRGLWDYRRIGRLRHECS